MKTTMKILAAALAVSIMGVTVSADSIMTTDDSARFAFPNLTGQTQSEAVDTAEATETEAEDFKLKEAVWPFNKNSEGSTEYKEKSTRKAFFLSMLVPGLGETYVGSKRGIFFMAVEAVSWWMYLTNTNEGNDLEDDFQAFADSHWHYTTTKSSTGADLDHNYYKWLQYQFRQVGKPDDIDPTDYARLNEQLEYTTQNSNSPIFGHSIHNLPSSKTQQYYEMIGKYPQFVYGWEDVGDTSLNPTIRDNDDTINFGVSVQNVNSPMRSKYEDMRDKSNDKLKAGQRGIHLMIVNRVISAIHAGRMAYKHNQRLKSELSTIDIQLIEKQVLDNRVPMLMLTKSF